METMTATFAFQLSLFPFMPFKTIIYYSCITVLKNSLFEYYPQEVQLYLLLLITLQPPKKTNLLKVYCGIKTG